MRSSRGSTISPRVLPAVDKGVAVEPVGEFILKGIRRPLTVYNVLQTSRFSWVASVFLSIRTPWSMKIVPTRSFAWLRNG
jgi:hypothetical protein